MLNFGEYDKRDIKTRLTDLLQESGLYVQLSEQERSLLKRQEFDLNKLYMAIQYIQSLCALNLNRLQRCFALAPQDMALVSYQPEKKSEIIVLLAKLATQGVTLQEPRLSH